MLPYLEESNAAAGFSSKLQYNLGDNAAVANLPMSVYVCPSMNLPRIVPEPDPACGESGAAGSYAVSTGSTLSFAFEVTYLPPHNGAIIHPRFGVTTIPKISSADGSGKTLLLGEMNYGLSNYLWSGCKPSGSVKWGETRWAVGYPGVTWASATGPLNPAQLTTLLYFQFYAEYESFRSDHGGGVNFAMVDGSVRFVGNSVEQTVLQALATRASGESLDAASY